MVKFDKGLLAIASGAGVAVVLPSILSKYLPAQYQTIPIPGIPAPWNQTKVFLPLVLGIGTFSVAQFTKLFVKKPIIKDMLWVFGFTSIVAAVVNGALNMGLGGPRFSAPVYRPAMGQPVRAYAPTPTGISNAIINA